MLSPAAFMLENFNPPWLWGGLVVIALVVLALTYTGIYRRSGRRLTWLLLALRTAGVLALLAAIIKPAWTDRDRNTHPPKLAVVVDNSQSMSLPSTAPGGDDGNGGASQPGSRYAQARRWLESSATARQLRERFELRLFSVDGEPTEQVPDQAAGEQTDLMRALRGAADQLRGQGLRGVVLLSDGRDTTDRQNFIPAGQYPHPVFALGFPAPEAGDQQAFDLEVASVDAPKRTLVHNTVRVKALLSKDGGGAMTVPVTIERGGQTLKQQRAELPAGRSQKMVEIPFTPEQPGDFVMTARAESPGGDRTAADNHRMFRLRVEAEPIRVLLVEGTLRNEFAFLRTRLREDPDVDLITFVRSANPDKASTRGTLFGSQLINDERLKKLDVIMLGDFEARMIQSDAYQKLRGWIESGGGLMVLGGYKNLAPGGLGETPLAPALPVETVSGAAEQVNEPFAFKPTERGQGHPVLQITGNRTRDRRLWAELPKLSGCVAVRRAKPAAEVLARHPRSNPRSDTGRGYPVLVAHRFGEGRSVALTADTTWRWSRLPRLAGQPDTLYVRFWSQMVRYLAKRDVQAETTALTVTTNQPSYERGNRVAVHIRRNPAVAVPGEEGGAELTATVETPEGKTKELTLERSASDRNLWTGEMFPASGGRYRVRASLQRPSNEGMEQVANQATQFLVRGSELEMEQPAPNPAALAKLARFTGGQYAPLHNDQQAAETLAGLDDKPRVTYRARTTHVWNHPLLLAAFVALVAIEWIVRRRNQLV